MKNQREIYEALLAGETLENGSMRCSLDSEGFTIDTDHRKPYHFDRPQDWSIYEKPKVLTKFYKYLYPNGELSKYFYTTDGKRRYSGMAGDLVLDNDCMTNNRIRTSLYIELEV